MMFPTGAGMESRRTGVAQGVFAPPLKSLIDFTVFEFAAGFLVSAAGGGVVPVSAGALVVLVGLESHPPMAKITKVRAEHAPALRRLHL
jgi:hypothetical protein